MVQCKHEWTYPRTQRMSAMIRQPMKCHGEVILKLLNERSPI
jgi:hypothetical protein